MIESQMEQKWNIQFWVCVSMKSLGAENLNHHFLLGTAFSLDAEKD